MQKKKNRKWLWLILPIAGIIAGTLLMSRTVTLLVDGNEQTVWTNALTVNGALKAAGIELKPGDSVDPAKGTFLANVNQIRVNRSGNLMVWVTPQQKLITVNSSSRIPGEILLAAGIELQPADRVMVNGRDVSPNEPLQRTGQVVLQYTPAVKIHLVSGLKEELLTSSADWLGRALWDSSISLNGASRLSVPYSQQLKKALSVTLVPAVAVEITVDGSTLHTLVPMSTTGAALASTGVSLQDLDYSIPAEQEPLPIDGKIKVVRVREEVSLEKTLIPFKTEYGSDPDLELDQTKIATLGKPGIQVVRVRTRFEDGVQVSQTREDAVVLQEPVNQQEVYGTKIVVKTMDTPEGPISYYRSVTVRVTSYSPCRSGGSRCYFGTSSGLPVKKGVIGVTRDWYRLFAMDQIYVPGYGIGTIADVGGGIPGSYWIDLGYSDSDWVNWWGSVTIYFLTPVPANVPGVLP